MKNNLITLTTIFTLLLSISPIFALEEQTLPGEENTGVQEFSIEEDSVEKILDDNTKSSENIYFDLQIEQKSQTPFGHFVPYVLTITPHLNSPKTQILWNTPSTLESRPNHSEFVSLQEGKEYIFEGKIKPLKEGTYDFSISVISWQHDTNYTNSINNTVVFNRDLVLQPVSSKFQLLNILKYCAIVIVFILIVVAVLLLVKKFTPKAKDWLTPPTWK